MIPVKLVVEVAVKEFYLNNADPDTIPRYIVNNLRMEFGRVYTRLLAATNLELTAVRENTLNNDTKLQIALYLNEASDILETMPELSFFENLDLIPEPDFFFEGLVLAVKSEVLSKQATIFKTKKFRKLLLTDRIRALKENVIDNHDEIVRHEALLTELIDSDLKDELLHYSKFERLNNEKLTPYFLKLAKTDSSPHSIDVICDDNGVAFQSESDREKHIVDFYETLYKKPIGPERDGTCINEFLSDIIDHPAVLDSKINEQERNNLEADLTLLEFDNAISEIKTNTSPGMDGISNRFIKKNSGHFFGYPYLNMPLFA
jgi:hypothetical protein